MEQYWPKLAYCAFEEVEEEIFQFGVLKILPDLLEFGEMIPAINNIY